MIDLHCHLLPGIDDGARDLGVSLEMARMAVADGVKAIACTPHILPGLYENTGPQIRQATKALQQVLEQEGIPLHLVTGADVHMVPDLAAGLQVGRLLSLNDTRYVLVEPPHHVAPVRIEDFFFNLLVAGYVPMLTHPERLSWIEVQYPAIQRMVKAGRLDADHRRLAGWQLRPQRAKMGQQDVGRRMRPHPGQRRARPEGAHPDLEQGARPRGQTCGGRRGAALGGD